MSSEERSEQEVEPDDSAGNSLDVAYVLPVLQGEGWRKTVRDTLNAVLGLTETLQIFKEAARIQDATDPDKQKDENVFLGVFRHMEMTMDHACLDQQIPESGAAIIVANHPFGGADAITLSALCIRHRADTKVMANAMASELPGMAKWCIPLQILGEEGATHTNRVAMKESLNHLRGGGLLVVFPAGAVSRWRNDLGRVADPEWSGHVARLALKTETPVLPVRFFGQNPPWFEILGVMHPIVRSALIIRAFLATRCQKVLFRGGKMIEVERLKQENEADDVTSLIRTSVESIPEP